MPLYGKTHKKSSSLELVDQFSINMQIDGKGAGQPKMSWKTLTERDHCE